jgi:hypothetical protein
VASRDEILAQIQALQAEADSMGDGEDYEIEIWNEKGAGTRLPARAGEGFLRTHFPELFAPDDPDNNGADDGKSGSNDGGSKSPRKVAPGNSGATRPATATKYFGKRPAGKLG